jgi:hypothetical protein
MMERLATDDRDFVSCEIRASEEAHAAITRHRFGVAWHDAENDDLVLNTERLTVAECVEEIVALLAGSRFQETEASRRVLADLALQAHVRAALRHDPRAEKANVGIDAKDGRVILSGVLDAGMDESATLAVVNSVDGVAATSFPSEPISRVMATIGMAPPAQ